MLTHPARGRSELFLVARGEISIRDSVRDLAPEERDSNSTVPGERGFNQ